MSRAKAIRQFDRSFILTEDGTDLTEYGYMCMKCTYMEILNRHPNLEEKTDNVFRDDDGSMIDLEEVNC